MSVKITKINCGHPVGMFPYYYADVRVENDSAQDYYINKIKINKAYCRDYVLFRGDRYVYEPLISGNGVTRIMARADWETDSEIRVEIELVSTDGKTRFTIAENARTSSYGGYWNRKWRYYFSLVLSERDGLHRRNQPVHTTIPLYKDRVTDLTREFRLVAIDPDTGAATEIPFQLSEIQTFDTEADEVKQPCISFDLAFYADLEPYQRKVYLGFYGNPEAPPPAQGQGLLISGTGYGKTLENDFYRIKLHPCSGVLDEITLKMGKNETFKHKLETNGAVHWNPGIYSPPRAWTHTSDWNPPEGSHFEAGPIYALAQMWGPLPLYPETMVSMTYLFYTKLPFVRMSSVFQIVQDINVQACRNGEIVLNHDLAKEFAWRDRHGEIRTVTIKSLPRFPEVPLTIAADTPWTAYYSDEHHVGLGSMTLNVANMRSQGGLVKLYRYEQMMNWGPWTYVSRTLVFPFCSKNPQQYVFLPKTSLYYEDMAFMPFVVHESKDNREKFREMEEWYQRLTKPITLVVEMDTDKRVPAEFILGERLEGRIKETEDITLPIDLDQSFTRFRQSPVLLNEQNFDILK